MVQAKELGTTKLNTSKSLIELDNRIASGNKLGYKILRADFNWVSDLSSYANNTLEIRDVYDANGGEIVIPDNVTLKFAGGRITNYSTITGTNTRIESDLITIFDNSGDLAGTWKVDRVYPQWFGAVGDGVSNDTIALQKAVNLGHKVYVTDGTYSFSKITLSVDGTELYLSNNAILSSSVELSNAIEITGDNCTLSGGILNVPATFDPTNERWLYANIYVTGAYVKVKGVTLNNVQKIGIGFASTHHCYVEDNIINGNYPGPWEYPTYTAYTAHAGICWDASTIGSTFVAINNKINTCVQGILIGNYDADADETGIMISNNSITRCFNHGIYCGSGQGQIIDGNNLYYCGIGIACKCDFAANITNNMLYLGHPDFIDANEVGLSLRDCVNTIVTGNNIIGKIHESGAAIAMVNVAKTEMYGNILANNNIKIDTGIVSTGVIFGSSSVTDLMYNNIISNNVIESAQSEFQGSILIRAKDGATCYGNVIQNNVINCELLNIGDAGVTLINTDNVTVKNNTINLNGNFDVTSTVFGIHLDNCEYCDILSNKVTMFSGNGTNTNIHAVRIEADCVGIKVEETILDASTSSAVVQLALYSFPTDTKISRNVNDARQNTYGYVTIASGTRIATLPFKNIIVETGGTTIPEMTGIVKNVNIRPINEAARTEVAAQLLQVCYFSTTAELIFPLNVAADCVFGWEIV